MKKKILFSFIIVILILTVGCERKDSGRNLTSDEKQTLMQKVESLKYFDFYGKNFVASDLSNQEVLNATINIMGDEVSFSNLKKYVEANIDFNLIPENLKCFNHDENSDDISSYYLLYNEETDMYEYNSLHAGHGGGGIKTDVYNRYRSSYNKDDIYTISVYKMFSGVYGDTGGIGPIYYGTYDDAKNGKNAILDLNEEYDWENLELLVDPQTYLNDMDTKKLVTYTYTFKKINDNYILIKYEIKNR